MLMQEATPEMIEQWKAVYAEFKPRLKPNRKPARELITYLTTRYPTREVTDEKLQQAIVGNVLSNACFAEKLPAGKPPAAAGFSIDDTGAGKLLYERQEKVFSGQTIFVGVELETGFFLVEGCGELYDELFAFRGLDEKDLDNFYLVAEYVACLRKFHMLDDVLAQ